ncbi:MAG: hypothetical protein RBR71_13320 [Gudongella sp.]|nr:hypothetical protein [Gudongella sp.]
MTNGPVAESYLESIVIIQEISDAAKRAHDSSEGSDRFDENDFHTRLSPEDWLTFDPKSVLGCESQSSELLLTDEERKEIIDVFKPYHPGEVLDEQAEKDIIAVYRTLLEKYVLYALSLIGYSYHALLYFMNSAWIKATMTPLPKTTRIPMFPGRLKTESTFRHVVFRFGATAPVALAVFTLCSAWQL